MTESTLTRGFEIRSINRGDVLGCAGYGIEVIDAGARGHQNLIIVGRGNYGSDEAYTEEASMHCWQGNKLIGIFDYIRCPSTTPTGALLQSDPIKLKIHTMRNVFFGDANAVAMTRRRGLIRGLTQFGLGAGLNFTLFETNGASGVSDQDDWSLDSFCTDKGYLDGWIACDQAFTVYLIASPLHTNGTPGNFYIIAKGVAIDRKTGAPGLTHSGGATVIPSYSFDFTWGQASNTSTVSSPWRCPGGAWAICVENTSGSPLVGQYSIGVRGAP